MLHTQTKSLASPEVVLYVLVKNQANYYEVDWLATKHLYCCFCIHILVRYIPVIKVNSQTLRLKINYLLGWLYQENSWWERACNDRLLASTVVMVHTIVNQGEAKVDKRSYDTCISSIVECSLWNQKKTKDALSIQENEYPNDEPICLLQDPNFQYCPAQRDNAEIFDCIVRIPRCPVRHVVHTHHLHCFFDTWLLLLHNSEYRTVQEWYIEHDDEKCKTWIQEENYLICGTRFHSYRYSHRCDLSIRITSCSFQNSICHPIL